jgi:hypothetical protein
MISRLILFLLTSLTATLISLPANATIISGNFSGHVSRILTPTGDSTDGLGDPVTGSFYVDTSYFAPSGGDGASTAEYFYFNVDPDVPSFALNFDSETGAVVEDLGAQTLRLQREAGLDSIYLSDYYPGGYGASLLLVGSNLFDALSPDAIVAGDVDLALSHAYMGSYLEDKGNAGSFIALDTASLAIVEVPEPPTLAMALLALCMTIFMRNKVSRPRRDWISTFAGMPI